MEEINFISCISMVKLLVLADGTLFGFFNKLQRALGRGSSFTMDFYSCHGDPK